MPIPPKRLDQKKHAKKRANQRYGLNLNSKDYMNLCELVKKADILAKQSLTRSIRKVIYKDVEYFVVYDKSRKQIATFLTKEMAEETAAKYKTEPKPEKEIENIFFSEEDEQSIEREF